MKVTGQFNFSTVAVEHDHTVTLMVRVEAPPPPSNIARKSLNLALVLDRSGSMAGDKIEHVRLAATQLVDQLLPTDRIAVVIFDDQVDTIVSSREAKEKEWIKASIRSTKSRGMTNLSGGWLAGLSEVSSAFSTDAINRVLLLTDGLANQGVTDRERLGAIGTEYREKGISTTTLGFGADFDEVLLARLADASGGAFYFIENPDDAPGTFREELGELLSVVGQNLTVEFRAQLPVTAIAVLNRYPTEPVPDGLRIQVGDLFGGEQREILAEMSIPGVRQLGPSRVGEIVVAMDQVVDPIEHHRIEVPVEINVVEPGAEQQAPDPEIERAAGLLRVSELRDKLIDLINAGELEKAESLLTELGNQLEATGLSEEVKTELSRVRAELEAYKARPRYGSKSMFYRRYRQRRSKGDYRK